MTASWHLRALDDEGNQRTPAWHHGRFGDLATAARTSKITVAIRSVRVLVDHRGSLAVCVPGLGQNACQPGRLRPVAAVAGKPGEQCLCPGLVAADRLQLGSGQLAARCQWLRSGGPVSLSAGRTPARRPAGPIPR